METLLRALYSLLSRIYQLLLIMLRLKNPYLIISITIAAVLVLLTILNILIDIHAVPITASDRFITTGKLIKLISLGLILYDSISIAINLMQVEEIKNNFPRYLILQMLISVSLGFVLAFLVFEVFEYLYDPAVNIPSIAYNKIAAQSRHLWFGYSKVMIINYLSMIPLILYLCNNIALDRKFGPDKSDVQKHMHTLIRVYIFLVDGPAVAGSLIVLLLSISYAISYSDIHAPLVFLNGGISLLVFASFIAGHLVEKVVVKSVSVGIHETTKPLI